MQPNQSPLTPPPTLEPQVPAPVPPTNYHNEGNSKAPWVLAILLIVAIVVAGFVGYLYFTQKQMAESDKTELQNQVARLRLDLRAAQATPPPTPTPVAPVTLAIKEWKVQFTLPANGNLAGLAYTYDAKTDAATFGSSSFEAKAVGCTTIKGDFGIVSRAIKGKAVSAATGAKIATIGTYDYYASPITANCGKVIADEQARVNYRNSIIDAVKVATATP